MVIQIADYQVTVSASTSGLDDFGWIDSSAPGWNWFANSVIPSHIPGDSLPWNSSDMLSTGYGYGGGKSAALIDGFLTVAMAPEGSAILPGSPTRIGPMVPMQTIVLAPINVLNRDRCFDDALDFTCRANAAGQEIVVTMLPTGARQIRIGSRPVYGATIEFTSIPEPDPSIDPLDVLGMLPPSFLADMERVLSDEQNYVTHEKTESDGELAPIFGITVNGTPVCPMGIPLVLAAFRDSADINGFPRAITVARYIHRTEPVFYTGPDHVLIPRIQAFMDAWDSGTISRMDVAVRLGTLTALEGVPA